jgi:outer membrane protein assembly factor BamE
MTIYITYQILRESVIMAGMKFIGDFLMMKRLFILPLLLLALTGCSYFHVHKMDIQQGNVITDDMVSRLHEGMTFEQVKAVMGTPVLTNVFDENRKDYVYTYKPGYGDFSERYVTVIFRNGRVSAIRGNLYSPYLR